MKNRQILIDRLVAEPEFLPPRKSRVERKFGKQHRDWLAQGVLVSDHAVIRYLEAIHGLDIKRIREEMVAQGRADIVKQLRTCKVPISLTGAKLVARDGLIVTVSNTKSSYKDNEK